MNGKKKKKKNIKQAILEIRVMLNNIRQGFIACMRHLLHAISRKYCIAQGVQSLNLYLSTILHRTENRTEHNRLADHY
jgi:hypothetical protein